MDVEKLKKLILMLDTLNSQGFIDTPISSEFDKKIRDLLVSTDIALYTFAEKGWISIACYDSQVLEDWIDVLTEILGKSVDELYKEEILKQKPADDLHRKGFKK